MLKKIVLGTLFIGLVAVLVIGAANRTSARASEADHTAAPGFSLFVLEGVLGAGARVLG